MRFFVALIVGLACHLAVVNAECPNACSAHGKCGAYDMCLCFRNWMSNDCSERICQFGLAHVDTPKGDLDSSSGALSGPGSPVVANDAVYPFGTTEQYPATMDLDGNVMTNTAHEYRECSNKGMCDRQTGNCACFEGYDGSACQRASCPTNADGVCSGHGTCESIKDIAARDFNNIYKLWDEDATMGCVCDGGYAGSDCSERVCKFGADPLYYDDSQNIRFSNFTYQIYTTAASVTLTGNYSIVFYDAYGEDWQTPAIAWNADCDTVIAALEELPNNAIPKDSVRCYKSMATRNGVTHGQVQGFEPIYNANKYVFSQYTLAFTGNPGNLQQIRLNKFLDGNRPTLFTNEAVSTLNWAIYPNGFIGENVDMVPDLCEDVMVTLIADDDYHMLGGISTAEAKLLKKCLGDGNGDATDNTDVYDWDLGSLSNPHLIKLIDATQDTSIATTDNNGDVDYDLSLSQYPITRLCTTSKNTNGTTLCHNRNPPGFYAVVYYDSGSEEFRVINRVAQDYSSTTQFYVYTTKGHLQMVNPTSLAYTNVHGSVVATNQYSNKLYLTTAAASGSYNGQIDCETTTVGVNGALDCIKKDDHVIVLATQNADASVNAARNPVYVNMYKVKKISREPKVLDSDTEAMRQQIVLDYGMNSDFLYLSGNAAPTDSSASVYKFYPPALANQYHYVGECSLRGLCNAKTGLCQCFPGYSEDNCAAVNAISN